jgi:hypothetical protein
MRRWTAILAFAGVLTLAPRAADAATVRDSFHGAVEALAERILEFVRAHAEFQRVTLQPVDGHGQEGAQMLFVELARALTKGGIALVPTGEARDPALLTLRPFLDIRHNPTTKKFLTEIGVSARDLAGRPQGEFERSFAGEPVTHDQNVDPAVLQRELDRDSRVFSTSTESVLEAAGVTVDLVGASDVERTRRILEAANSGTSAVVIRDGRVCLDGVCLQILSGPSDRVVKVVSKDGQPIVSPESGNFDKGAVYFVRVQNENDFRVGVELRIDGINVGEFGRGTRGIVYLLAPKGASDDHADLRTWQDDLAGGRSFRVGDYHESAAKALGIAPTAPGIGVIQVLVRRAFPKGADVPLAERDGGRDKGPDDAVTGFGARTDQPVKVEDVVLGATRTAIAIRYSGR